MSFSLYVHIPYCLVKCPYCDFNAYGGRTWPEEGYVDALCAELRLYAEQVPWQGEQVETLYFGGGTPSLFAPASIDRFVHLTSSLFPFASDCEITLEADPALCYLGNAQRLSCCRHQPPEPRRAIVPAPATQDAGPSPQPRQCFAGY